MEWGNSSSNAPNTFSSSVINVGSATIASTQQFAYGATTAGLTKTVNVGTGGLSGSTTNITVGGTAGTSTTTMLGSTVIGGASGNQSLQVNNVASAVNYAQIVGAVTGNGPTISAQGTDTNIGLTVLGKGSGGITIGGTSWSNPSLLVSTVASQVNSFQVYGNTTGNSPVLAAVGTDTNIQISINAKGTGGVTLGGNGQQIFTAINASGSDFTNYYNTTGSLNYTAAGGSSNINFYFGAKGTGGYNFSTGGGQQVAITNTASAVNYLNLTGAATSAAPTISAQGSDANINLKLTPKGTGDVQITGTAYSPNFNLTDAATIAWDTATAGGQVATFTFVSSNRTMGAPTNLVNGAFYALAVIQNAGSNTLTWNSVFKFAGGIAPTLSTAAGAKDYFTFRSDGVSLFQQGISQAVA